MITLASFYEILSSFWYSQPLVESLLLGTGPKLIGWSVRSKADHAKQ